MGEISDMIISGDLCCECLAPLDPKQEYTFETLCILCGGDGVRWDGDGNSAGTSPDDSNNDSN